MKPERLGFELGKTRELGFCLGKIRELGFRALGFGLALLGLGFEVLGFLEGLTHCEEA